MSAESIFSDAQIGSEAIAVAIAFVRTQKEGAVNFGDDGALGEWRAEEKNLLNALVSGKLLRQDPEIQFDASLQFATW